MIGPGKYDEIATQAREASHARGVIVIVFGGDKGTGFSVQTDDIRVLMDMPQILRSVADEIDSDKRSL